MDKAYEIKKVVNIPVLSVNRIKDPVMADQYLELGWFDLVGLSRASLADPHFPEKAQKEGFQGIRPCLGCKTCENEIFIDHQCHCAVNPYLGQEWKYTFEEKTEKIKNVMVIGGGPADLQRRSRQAEDVLPGKVQVEGNLVVAGGGEVGIETAAYLAMGERGDITIVEMLPVIGDCGERCSNIMNANLEGLEAGYNA